MTSLGALAWPDVSARTAGQNVLAIPLGATEQHGPHLPISTDTDIATALCEQLALRRDVVVAPALAYGSSGEHEGFPGTLSIGQAALELLLVELCRSATNTFGHIVLVSGHGGNADAVTRATKTLRAEGRDVIAHFPRWAGDPHAGRAETALQLALRPENVLMARAECGDLRTLEEIMPLLKAHGLRHVTSNGVLGDPRGATAADGRALLERLAVDLTRQVDDWLSISSVGLG